ncbi:thiamine diphosphokinase [bacterium]|nr:thiamine diphosphokinase [bacterium]
MEKKVNDITRRHSALLVLNGEFPDSALFDALLEHHSLIICADGAANILLNMGFWPEVIIGDLDSVEIPAGKEIARGTIVIENGDQYSTDFEKALLYLSDKGFKEISIVGLKGGRFDHQITNLSILCQFSSEFNFRLFDNDGIGYVLTDSKSSMTTNMPANTVISLLPLTKVTGIQTRRLKYPLDNEALQFGDRNGQSNASLGGEISISLKSGSLICYILMPSWWTQREMYSKLINCY